MEKHRQIITALVLVEPEDDLIGLALTAMHGAAVRIDRGSAATSDAATMRICREIVEGVERARTDRHEAAVAMFANTLEPAAA